MSKDAIRALDASTWDAFARLVEKHNGCGFGGCWCTGFHPRKDRLETEDGRAYKERLVREGKAHAALVFDGDAAVAWCQYGSLDELPWIYHLKEWEAGLTGERPAYRITCIFVDRDYRRKGVATAAVRGALDLIANEGAASWRAIRTTCGCEDPFSVPVTACPSAGSSSTTSSTTCGSRSSPVVLGAGERLFGATGGTKPMRLVGAQPLGDGVVLLTYEPFRAN